MYREKIMKNKDYLLYFEPFLLYLTLFLPSVFTNNAVMASFFASPVSMANYIAISIPPILLILYFFYTKKWDFKDNFNSGRILKTIFLIIIYTFLLLIISNSAAFILILLKIMQNVPKINAIKQLIPFYLLVSLITGYREELFFRAYLTKFFEKTVNKIVLTIVISSMFAICHIAQGAGGVIISFLNSMLLCFIFFRHNSIHINAVSHALYNFFVLLVSVFSA